MKTFLYTTLLVLIVAVSTFIIPKPYSSIFAFSSGIIASYFYYKEN
jgi:hypothetical protein